MSARIGLLGAAFKKLSLLSAREQRSMATPLECCSTSNGCGLRRLGRSIEPTAAKSIDGISRDWLGH